MVEQRIENPRVRGSIPRLATKTRLCQQALAERWGLSPKTLERWRVLGIGPVYIRLPGKVVYRIEDVEAFERSSLRQSTDQAYREGGAA